MDGFTSLAVVVGVVGVALGFELADPIVGLAISLAIFRIVWQSARTIGLRTMDGIEEGTIDSIDKLAASIEGVREVTGMRARWLGHSIRAEVTIALDPGLSVQEAHGLAERVRHQLIAEMEHITEVVVQTEAARPATSTHPLPVNAK